MVTVTQLRALVAVAQTGAVHAAAEQLHVTQPSVSAALSALARELGADMLEREGRGVRLTAAGAALEPYARQVLGLLEQGGQAVLEARAAQAARIRVVAVNTAGEYLLPPLIQAYRALEPGAEILLEIGNRETVLDRLRAYQADLGVGGRPPGRELEGAAFLDNELIVVGREAPADLGAASWLLREPGSGTRGATERFLAERGLDPPERLTLGSNGAVKQALAIGLGVTLISAHAVGRELREGRLVRIAAVGTPLVRPWYVLLPRGVPTRPSVAAFRDFLHSRAAREVIEKSL
ncbi:MAG TPA: LysR family transcriptional regulator [Gaiellaceae bacterium]|nr:LysR family transcriptional regulator [Gaiellaceae bacterium]